MATREINAAELREELASLETRHGVYLLLSYNGRIFKRARWTRVEARRLAAEMRRLEKQLAPDRSEEYHVYIERNSWGDLLICVRLD